jgi:ATP-dependent Clp protease ATP-binding subunit ClpA|tara:strand:+ start:9362 stop:10717 length:1356 start_codon:yes stop_codon:yes gene_type:complete
MKSKTFKLFCKELDEIISVKSFDLEEEEHVYSELKTFLSQIPASFGVFEYKKKVIDVLLIDASSYYTFEHSDIEVDDSLMKEVITALYSTIIQAYPHFEFEFICNDINNTIAFEHMRSVFKKHIEGFEEVAKSTKVRKIRNLADLVKLSYTLSKEVIGQKEACDKTVDAIKLIAAGIDKFSSLFYIGPTGVGKTKLAKILGESYSGNFFKVNCGEYSSAHDYAKLIGAPPGYVGHSETSLLGEKAEKSNAWVILFDEIEKANSKFFDFLLSILDDGTCTDNMGNTLDFSESIFIFTTNEGVQDNRLGDTRMGFSKEKITYEGSQDIILDSIKKKFAPEFMNRLDHFIFFNRLNEDELVDVAKLEMDHLPVRKNKGLLKYIVSNSNHEEYGARNISKFIKNNVSTLIADAILKKKIPTGKGRYYTFKIKNNDLYISNIEENSNDTISRQTES